MTARTVFTVLEETAALHGGAVALNQPLSGGGYRTYTWNEFRRAVEETACGLRARGLARGDIVALVSETRAEFFLADLGTMANGSVAAALYTSLPDAERARTLKDCRARAVFVEHPESLRSLLEAGAGGPGLLWILLTGESPGALTLDELRRAGRAALERDPRYFNRIRAEVQASDPGILYLTSGATGEPKMALVSQAALVGNIDMGPAVLDVTNEDRALVFLPSAHIAQRVVLELVPVRMGVPVWFSESLARLPHELKSVRPTFFLAPPRVWERIYSSICAEIRKRPAFIQKMFHGALGLGLEANRRRREGQSLPRWLAASLKTADRLIFRRIRARFGGRLRIAASGAAPLARNLAEFYAAIGMPLIEGYGLTEGGIVALNPLDRPRPGSVGRPLPGVEVRFAEDGELLVKTPALFSGYFEDPQATASVVRDGWLHTGDMGEADADGFLYVTGRKKELIVSSSGKKIYPARIESLFKTEPIINQVLLIGDRLPYLSAVFTLNFGVIETLKGMAEAIGRSHAELIHARPVIDEVRQAVARVNRQLAGFEQIRKFRILERDFSIEYGELTPTMKLRRGRVLENLQQVIRELYAGKAEFA